MPRTEPAISAIIVARDEEEAIERCLRSIAWTEERIVVVDSATRDATAERARPLATEVVIRDWEGFVATKRFAAERTRCPWVLWLDADEEVDPELAEAIRSAVADPRGAVGFRMRRRNHYMGRLIRHGAWSRDSVLRLFARDRARWVDRLVHEEVRVDGPVADLSGRLDHWSYRDLRHHRQKIRVWSTLWAEQSQKSGKRAWIHDLLLRPPLRFVKGYFLKGGFLDGGAGLVLAYMDAVYVGTKYARLRELQRPGREKGEQ